MAGSVSAATLLALGGLAVGATGATVAAVTGARSNDAQKTALKNQNTSTQTAEANALSTERKNATATNAANQQAPDISSILSSAANSGKAGVGSTMLTGSGGVAGGSLNLGKSTLLGS
jgi:membrane protein involved in colicin uptake